MATTLDSGHHTPAQLGLHGALWTAQIVLAVVFLMTGLMMVSVPATDLAQHGLALAGRVPGWEVTIVGIAEILGAVGLIVPNAIHSRPLVTPVAALGLLLLMTLAMFQHASHGEFFMIPINVTLGSLAAFVAVGRTAGVTVPEQPPILS